MRDLELILEVDSILRSADFKPVSLGDRDLFKRHYENFPQVHSDNVFTNMVCWNHYAHYRYAYAKDNIVISSTIEGKTSYRPPIGPPDTELLADIIGLAADSNSDTPLEILGYESKEWVASLCPEVDFHPMRDYFEYVYLASDLAELPGKRYATMRHQLHKFQKRCLPAIMPLTLDLIPEVYEFLDKWCEWRDCESETMLSYEKEAILFALDHYEELKLSGLAIRVEGNIGAISIFEGIGIETALVHFEKGLRDCKEIYRAINAETAKLLAGDYVYINRESDMGVEGIREAKMRYHPDHMVEVYLVRRDDLKRIL